MGARRVIHSRSAAPGRWLIPVGLVAMLAACGGTPEGAGNVANGSGQEQLARDRRIAQGATELPGTPMAQREAVVGLLNKRNGITRRLTMKPGEALRVGNAIVRLRACETTAPWETEQETGAFVQLDILESGSDKWRRVFSGWLFKERPDRNVVLNPIYDVWVISCAMSWPETGPDTVRVAAPGRGSSDRGAAAGNASSDEKTPTPAPSPAPSPSASPSNIE